MQTIFKYRLDPNYETVMLPFGAEIFHAARQNDHIYIWAIVNPDAELSPRKIHVLPTGHAIPEVSYRHIDSVHMHNGALVFHVFEVLDEIAH